MKFFWGRDWLSPFCERRGLSSAALAKKAGMTAYSDESERLIRRRRTPGPMMAVTVGAKRRELSVAR
jgi:hypothetical protein